MQQLLPKLKPFLRWAILGGTLFFLVRALIRHWGEVSALRLNASGWAMLTIALGVTLLAHIWSGWVWSWILREFNQPAPGSWGVVVYLKTNIAKYLPGNIWHLYGRAMAAKNVGIPLGIASLSVLLEPLLMAAAALGIALVSGIQGYWLLQMLSLGAVLAIVHPKVLNPLLKLAGRIKGRAKDNSESSVQIRRYPLKPLLGEVAFVLLRGAGFVLTVLALGTVEPTHLLPIVSGFSIAWLLGLVIPGAPGGIGVFEATAVALLSSKLSPGLILGSVALYRLISILAEAGGAGLAWADDRLMPSDPAPGEKTPET